MNWLALLPLCATAPLGGTPPSPLPPAAAAQAGAPAAAIGAVHHRVAVARGETLHVAVSGAGATVVVVPGTLSNAYAFRHVVRCLAGAGYRLVVIEPLGVAFSGVPPHADYSVAAQGRRVAAVLDSLAVPRALFVGQASSTSMLLHLAADEPGRVEGILSIEGGVVEGQGTPGMQRALAVGGLILRVFPSQALLRWKLRGHLERVSGDKTWISREVLDAYIAPMRGRIGETIAAYGAIASAREPVPLAPRLGHVNVPVTVLLGDAPHFGGPSPDELAVLTTSLRNVVVRRVPGAGHLIHEERPDAVVQAIGSFAGSRVQARGAR
jgi:magnesium chelatase accessory protein